MGYEFIGNRYGTQQRGIKSGRQPRLRGNAMYDLILLMLLTLPLLVVSLAGRHSERGLPEASPETLAKRRYYLSWFITLAILGQLLLLSTLFSRWDGRISSVEWLFAQLDGPVDLMVEHIGKVAAAVILSVTMMLVVIVYFSLYFLPWLRLERAIKRMQGGVIGKRPVWRTLRSMLAMSIPAVLWGCLGFALPQGFLKDPAYFGLLLVGFLLVTQSLSPWLVQLANPTTSLSADHPVTQMAMALGRAAGVRIGAVRIITLGEAKVANAMVSGLWPPLRCIYLTDHMLATFSMAEIRAILAHEVGHLHHGHLWWYFGFALGGVLIIPQAAHLLDYLEFFRGSTWSTWIAIGLYWGLMFKFFSRRFEREADRYAVAATGDVVTFQQALEKLAEVNGAVKQYAKWDVFQTHLPVAERIKALG